MALAAPRWLALSFIAEHFEELKEQPSDHDEDGGDNERAADLAVALIEATAALITATACPSVRDKPHVHFSDDPQSIQKKRADDLDPCHDSWQLSSCSPAPPPISGRFGFP